MSLVVSDRVVETSTSTGTGDITLAGAVTGYQRFSAKMAVGDMCYYTIEGINASGTPTGEWETGLGTYSAANTLTRTTVKDSSNAGAAVTFSAGTKRVFLNMIAAAIGTGRVLANFGLMPPLTNFTQDNTTTDRTIVEYAGKAISMIAKNALGATQLHGLRRAVPGSTPYRVVFYFQTNNPGYQYFGIASGWSNGTAHHIVYDQGGALEYAPYTNSSSRGAVTVLTGLRPFPVGVGVWIGLHDDGTNWIWEISSDGGNFIPLRSMAKVAGYSQIYVGLFSFNSTLSQGSLSVLYYDENGLTRTVN